MNNVSTITICTFHYFGFRVFQNCQDVWQNISIVFLYLSIPVLRSSQSFSWIICEPSPPECICTFNADIHKLKTQKENGRSWLRPWWCARLSYRTLSTIWSQTAHMHSVQWRISGVAHRFNMSIITHLEIASGYIILIEGNYLEIEWILACKDTHSLGRIIALNQAWLGQSFYTLNVVLPRIANVSQELCVFFNMSIIAYLKIEQILPWLRAIILPKGFTECDTRQ